MSIGSPPKWSIHQRQLASLAFMGLQGWSRTTQYFLEESHSYEGPVRMVGLPHVPLEVPSAVGMVEFEPLDSWYQGSEVDFDLSHGLMARAQEHFEKQQLSKAWHPWRCFTLVQQICDAWAKLGVSKSTSEVWRLTGADLTKLQVALVEVLRRVAKDLGWYKLLDYG